MKEELEKLKSADTAITIYENKFQEMNAKDQKKDVILKQKSDVIEEHKVANKQLKQTIQDKDEVNTRMKAEISKVSQEKEELARQLAEAEKMLANHFKFKDRLMELLQKSESKKWDFQVLHQVMVDLH